MTDNILKSGANRNPWVSLLMCIIVQMEKAITRDPTEYMTHSLTSQFPDPLTKQTVLKYTVCDIILEQQQTDERNIHK